MSIIDNIEEFYSLDSWMQINFKNKDLLELYQNPTIGKGYYPPGVIKNYIKVVTLMYSIDTIMKLNLYGHYNVEEKKWNLKGIRAARLNDARRLEFTIDKNWDIHVVNLERISNHYQ